MDKGLINKTGIYKITNKINGKFYYGSAQVGFNNRWRNHKNKLNKNGHENIHLQNSWNTYGPDSFEFNIILLCDKNNCLYYEQLFLDRYFDNCVNCYNICPTAGNCQGTKASPETRKKMSENAKQRPPNNKGKPRSQEAKDKNRQTRSKVPNSQINISLKQETRDKMSIKAQERIIPEEIIKKRSLAIMEWWSNRETARVLDQSKVAQIMKMMTENFTLKQIGDRFGVSLGTITNIRIGRAWKKAIELLEPSIKEAFLQIQQKAIDRKLKSQEKIC